MEYKIEDLILMNPENYNENQPGHKIWFLESKVSKEEKIDFVDGYEGGRLSYILELLKMFETDKDDLKKDRYGEINTLSLAAWIKRNDPERIIAVKKDFLGQVGDFVICGLLRNIKDGNQKSYRYDTYDDLVDEVFNRKLKHLYDAEIKYYCDHDEYEILKTKVEKMAEKHHTTFGVPIAFSSNNSVYITNEGNYRDITIEELKLLVSKYEEVDRLVEQISSEINISY